MGLFFSKCTFLRNIFSRLVLSRSTQFFSGSAYLKDSRFWWSIFPLSNHYYNNWKCVFFLFPLLQRCIFYLIAKPQTLTAGLKCGKNHFSSIFTTISYIYEWIFFNMSYCVCVSRKNLCNRHSSFFPSRPFFWTSCQKLFSQRFNISYQESVWSRSDSFLGHTKNYFRKNCSRSSYSRCVWHMTWFMQGNQHSQHPKSTRNNQKLGNKLASRWQKIQGSNREKSSW